VAPRDHCVFLSPNSVFNYVISVPHIRLICAIKNFLLTYLLILRLKLVWSLQRLDVSLLNTRCAGVAKVAAMIAVV